MYCSKCGVQNSNDAKFCSGCGSQLGTNYAGFWRRFVAMFLDRIILTIGGLIIGVILGVMIGLFGGAMGIDITTIQAIGWVVGCIIDLVLNWLYFTLFESSSKQATLGKMALGIVVTDLNGNRISFGRANGRYWGKIVSTIILFIGFIMVAFTQKKQGLHDIMARTLVVKKKK